MTHTLRIGLQIDHEDPFWVQVREAVWQRGLGRAGELIEVAVQEHSLLLPDEQVEAVEDLLVQAIDALICNTYPASLIERILERGIPIVYVSESPLRHPRFVSRHGLFEAGAMLGAFMRERLARGSLLIVGGLVEGIDRGQSLLDGFVGGLGDGARLSVHHIPTPWLEEQARPYIAAWLADHPGLTIDAIYGLSDPLALAARELCAAAGRLGPETIIVGVNGDPLALAAVHAGLMAATVETDVVDIAGQAVELAFAAARGEALPPTFTNRQRLITAANVAERAVHKLMSLAALPSRLVGVNRHAEQQRTTQREAGAAIERKVDTLGAATEVLLKTLGDEALLGALSDLDPHVPDGSILIVEDDPNVRAQHRRLIAGQFPGYVLRDAGDGRAALAAIAASPPSLIMLDLVLPELDGFAVLEALRADRRTAGVPVLVLSGKLLTGEDIRRLSQARVTFQTKDLLSASELAAALRRTMEQAERLPPHTSALVKRALAFMQQQYGAPLSRQTIAEAVGVNKDYLGRIFQQELGLSPWEYLIRYRVLRAKALLRETDLAVAAVATRVGFETPSYFSQAFHREVGCSPRTFRARGHA